MGESVVEVHTSEGNLFLVNLKGPGGCITIQLTLTLKMTTAKVVETSVTVNNNSPIQDYVHPDNQTQPTFEMTPGFKPFTVIYIYCLCFNMVSFRGQKKAWATPRSVSFRGLIQNFRRAFPPLSYAESPPPG